MCGIVVVNLVAFHQPTATPAGKSFLAIAIEPVIDDPAIVPNLYSNRCI